MLTYIDGKPDNQLSISNRGLAYGDGFFETMLVKARSLPYLDLHLQRVLNSAERLDMAVDLPLLQAEVHSVLKQFPDIGCFCLKLIIIRAVSERGYGYQNNHTHRLLIPSEGYVSRGWDRPTMSIDFLSTQITCNSSLAGMKHLNRLDSVLASKELKDRGLDEGVYLLENQVISGSKHNLFVIDSFGRLKTPKIKKAGIDGVMRRHLLENFDVVEAEIHKEELKDAKSIFMTNALVGIWPVSLLGSQKFTQDSKLKELIQGIE